MLSPTRGQVAYALLTRLPLGSSKASFQIAPFDLHVLSTPPAFVLSQDQTLQNRYFEEPLGSWKTSFDFLTWLSSRWLDLITVKVTWPAHLSTIFSSQSSSRCLSDSFYIIPDFRFFVNKFFLSMFQLKHFVVEKPFVCCFLKEKACIV